ncbi:preprotein translocase subunit SecY [Sediminivirga luteola]|uniref:Protein translocase subunit SecY n=1 Tax=Sediminivirga luteola TaxID=1774748 RepID=A0A8J2XK40_9MICO|nr:preprotein translocase subunit SecY [Sediminivirga luteola]MCI2266447.1 preprotein translocase subunit SecY [Sediminivirga luteola]GGA11437.1 protein translocase subunit SecY [Sediminivirga luteola]
MLGAIGRAFRTPDLRRKLLFTLAIIVLYRLGSYIPAPGVDYTAVQACVNNNDFESGAFGLINLFSGGALLQLSVFALGIMPYITASIITQLLRVVIPRFEQLHKEGATGQAKLTQYTRYMTIGLALLNATTLIATARTGALFGNAPGCDNLIADETWFGISVMVLAMTAGTGLIMWMGEQITERGVGNGMSILIFTAVAAGFPAALGAILSEQGIDIFVIVCAVGLLLVALVVFVEQSQRRVPVQYAKRMVGRRMFGGTSTYIPIKVNMAGVIPVIFSSSVLYLPSLISQFGDPEDAWVQWIGQYLTTGDHPVYMAGYFLLTIFFTYFYVAITFNPEEVADNMKRYGGFIPGIRAGRPTAEYLNFVLTRITFTGALYLAFVAMIPLIALVLINANQNFPFGGTSLLIIVGVGLETVKQIDSQMQQRHYEGLLR